jgi:tetratricopeptide (TPR) repeat protein
MTAAQMLREYPALGMGLGGFYYGYIPHQGAALRDVPIDRYLPVGEVVTWAHNDYLQEFLETGLAGFVLLLSLLAGAAVAGFRRANGDPAAWWLTTSLLIMGALAIVDFPFHRPSEAVLVFCLLGLLARSGRKQPGRAPVSSRGIACACAALFALAAALTFMHWRSLRLLNEAYTAPEGTSPTTITHLLERSLRLSLRPGQVQASWGAHLCKNGEREKGISMMEEGLGTYRDALVYEYLGRVCAESGDLDRAAAAFQSALDSGLNYASNAAMLSRIEFLQGKTESALARLSEAKTVFPKNTDLALALAEHYYATGDFSRCLEALAPVAKRDDPEVARLRAAALAAQKAQIEARDLPGVSAPSPQP